MFYKNQIQDVASRFYYLQNCSYICDKNIYVGLVDNFLFVMHLNN